MNKKALFVAGCVLLVAVFIFFLFQKSNVNSKKASVLTFENRVEAPSSSSNAHAELPSNKGIENTPQASAVTKNGETSNLEDDVADDTITLVDVHIDTLVFLVQSYRKEFGKYPPTKNAALMLAMMGQNPSGKKFLNWPKTALSPAGEFLDPWGEPYVIKIDEATSKIEVRSAGPDRQLETKDDTVLTK